VHDARSDPEHALAALAHLRAVEKRSGAKCVLIASLRAFPRQDVAAMRGETRILLLLGDVDPIVPLIRTHLADPLPGTAAVSAHRTILAEFPRRLHDLCGTAFGIGPHRVSVARFARALGHHYTTLERHLDHANLPPPLRIVEVVRASYAVKALRSRAMRAEELARQAGFGDAPSLRRLLLRTFGVTSSVVRRGGEPASLPALLRLWKMRYLPTA
jgi:AraC-like DNA-binding protein